MSTDSRPVQGPIGAYAGIICAEHGNVDISFEEYMRQVYRPDERWKCPICGRIVEFDDCRFEEINFGPDDESSECIE